MFNMINIGEHAGNGVPNILQTWDAQGWKAPEVEKQYEPDRTRLALTLTDTEGNNVPQDINLLNEARENLEANIDTVCYENNEPKPRTYRQNARRQRVLTFARDKT